MSVIETDFLIVGAGPAGGALACFLAQHDLKGIMISSAPSTADTPRAHITNMATLECLRDIGLEEQCLKLATTVGNMQHTRWCHDMAGEEYARIYSWGHDPRRIGDYAEASPCEHVDLPQTLLEPVLLGFATKHGWDVRFNHELKSLEQETSGSVVSLIWDKLSDSTYSVRSRYLFGCDGARSQVMRQLGIPLIKKPGGSTAINVHVEADLSQHVESRVGNLHWCIQPECDSPEYSGKGIVRMVKPWREWIFIIIPRNPSVDVSGVTEDQWLEEVRRYIGDRSISVTLKSVSAWKVNEIVAERYSEGSVFCLGDAVHRHPPFNGLGSNTCIQDAYNLAWKIACVHKQIASPALIETYSTERQPVGVGVITRANQGFRDHFAVWEAMGVNEPDLNARLALFEELKAATPSGRERRRLFRKAVEGTRYEFHALGQEMGQRYESQAVYLQDETSSPATPDDPVLKYRATTYPGSRLPHVWLNTRAPGKRLSTIDLAGHGRFCLFTGVGGDPWKKAAAIVGDELGIQINAYSIGWCQDYEDAYGAWAKRSEVEEDGAILTRPDRFVCWRSREALDDPVEKLRLVLKTILGRS